MRSKLWVITVTPQVGYGAPYLYIFHDGETAVDKFHAIARENNLDITGLLNNCAVANSETKKHIDRIDISPHYTMD